MDFDTNNYPVVMTDEERGFVIGHIDEALDNLHKARDKMLANVYIEKAEKLSMAIDIIENVWFDLTTENV